MRADRRRRGSPSSTRVRQDQTPTTRCPQPSRSASDGTRRACCRRRSMAQPGAGHGAGPRRRPGGGQNQKRLRVSTAASPRAWRSAPRCKHPRSSPSALAELIDGSDNVLVMGHRFADLDCLGAAVGLYGRSQQHGQAGHALSSTAAPNLGQTDARRPAGDRALGRRSSSRRSRRSMCRRTPC